MRIVMDFGDWSGWAMLAWLLLWGQIGWGITATIWSRLRLRGRCAICGEPVRDWRERGGIARWRTGTSPWHVAHGDCYLHSDATELLAKGRV